MKCRKSLPAVQWEKRIVKMLKLVKSSTELWLAQVFSVGEQCPWLGINLSTLCKGFIMCGKIPNLYFIDTASQKDYSCLRFLGSSSWSQRMLSVINKHSGVVEHIYLLLTLWWALHLAAASSRAVRFSTSPLKLHHCPGQSDKMLHDASN